jgi:hypothetical protein
MCDVLITSAAFSSRFEIKTPVGDFSTKKIPLEGTCLFNSSGTQIARIQSEGFLGTTCNIVISGGGFYQFACEKTAIRAWTCQGEGKQFRIAEEAARRFIVSDETRQIAEGSKSRFFQDYRLRIFKDADLKLIVCMFVALKLQESAPESSPD